MDNIITLVSVPYSLGLWLQLESPSDHQNILEQFQFPIHWDCGCNERNKEK